VSTRSRRYGPRDPHAPNTEHSYPPYHRKMLFFMLQRSVLTPNNPPRRSGLSEGFPRTYSGPHAVITPPNLGQTPAHNANIHVNPVFRLFVDHDSVSQAELGAYFTRVIDSIHQGLSNALLD
jgi:hypothetical protein